MTEYSISSKLNSVNTKNTTFDTALSAAYTDINSADIQSNLGSRLEMYAEYENLHEDISGVQGNINAYDEVVREKELRNIQKGNFFSAGAIRLANFNEGMKAIFIAILVSLVFVLLLAVDVINVTIAIIAIVIALTISIIYAASVMVVGGNLSTTLPGIFDWDFTLRSE